MNLLLLLFEVMDKEPSLSFIWGYYLILGIGGFFLTRLHPAFLFLILLFVYVFASLVLSEINDPYVGKAIIQEVGEGYITQSYYAISFGAVVPFLGIIAWFFKRKRKLAVL